MSPARGRHDVLAPRRSRARPQTKRARRQVTLLLLSRAPPEDIFGEGTTRGTRGARKYRFFCATCASCGSFRLWCGDRRSEQELHSKLNLSWSVGARHRCNLTEIGVSKIRLWPVEYRMVRQIERLGAELQ